MKLLLLIFFLNIVLCAKAAKILFFATVPSISHFRLSYPIAKALADKGHQLTVVSPFPRHTPIPNYKDVTILEILQNVEAFQSTLYQINSAGFTGNINMVFGAGLSFSEATLQHPNVQKLFKSNKTFDLFIIDQLCTESLFATAKIFNVPIIIISGLGTTTLANYFVGNPAQSSYTWNFFSQVYKTKTNFWDRLENFLFNSYVEWYRNYYFLPVQRQIVKKYISPDINLNDVIYNVSLILSNSHVTLQNPAPRLPSVIDIAGYHIQKTQKLPTNLQNYLDNCKNGFILFAMGSNLKSKDLTPEIQKAIMGAFSKSDINILWKYEQNLENLPKNVKIQNWIPQQDVLAHSNIRGFITHGGMLSTVESVYFGVPIIGIPVFGDQMSNIATSVAKGYGVSIKLTELTEEKLLWALNEILENSKYRKNVEKASILMHDRALHPLDEAIYWIEHVIRHRGAPHLRTSALDLNWFQREAVDVISFLVLFLFSVSSIFVAVVVLSYRYYFKTTQKAVVVINKKKD